MNKSISIVILTLILSSLTFAQDLRKSAEENPLECAYFLLTKNKDFIYHDRLADAYFEVGRFDKALQTIKLTDEVNYWLTNHLEILIEQKRIEFANQYADEILKSLQNERDDEVPKNLLTSLVKLNRVKEALKLLKKQKDDDDDYFDSFIDITIADYQIGNQQRSKESFTLAFKLTDGNHKKYQQIGIYLAKLGEREKALKVALELEKKLIKSKDDLAFQILQISKIYFELGNPDKVEELWHKYGDLDDYWQLENLTKTLIENGHKNKALPYLSKLSTNKNFLSLNGQITIQHFLDIGDITNANNLARTMSTKDDNYSQQMSLLLVANWYINNSDSTNALELLNIAYKKANKVVFKHLPQQSNGASSGSRKIMYLRNIYQALMKINENKKAFQVINSINSDHEFAKEFLAESIIDFAKQQTETLSKKQIEKLLSKAQKFIDKDSEYHQSLIKLSSVEIYIKINDEEKAVNLIAEALSIAKESCCYQEKFLLEAGKLFNKHNLKANKNLKNILSEIIENELS